MTGNEGRQRRSIGIAAETKAALDSIKGQGQSYNGLIQELVEFWKDQKGDYWTRRRTQRGKGERGESG